MFLGGRELLTLLVLAFGAAMAIGSAAALVRPPEKRADTDLERPPVGRSVVMIVIGGLAALWAIASMIAG